MISFACPHCSKSIEVQQDALGSIVSCPHCTQQVKITLDMLFSDDSAEAPSSGSEAARTGPPQAGKTPFRPQFPVPVPNRPPGVHSVLIQAGSALGLTLLFYLIAFFVDRGLGRQITVAAKFVDRGWTPYVCVLLTAWSICILFTKWRLTNKRERCIAASSIPASVSLGTELGSQEATSIIWAVARQYGDDLLARRVQKLIEHFRTARSPEAVAEGLNVESDAALGELEAGYTLVRVFLWTIPILGFIGTVAGIAGAVGGFASFLSVGAQELDDIKTALTKITADLALAFDSTLVALLLSVVVMLAMSWVESKEKTLLQLVDDFCRDRLLPMMRTARAQSIAAAEDGFARGAAVLRDAIRELRESLAGFAKAAGSEWSSQIAQALAGASVQWTGGIGELRAELAIESAKFLEISQQQLENGSTLKEELAQALQGIQRTLIEFCQRAEAAVKVKESFAEAWRPAGHTSPEVPIMAAMTPPLGRDVNGTVLEGRDVDGVSVVLKEVQEGLQNLEPFLRRFAERLRALENQPEDASWKIFLKSNKGVAE